MENLFSNLFYWLLFIACGVITLMLALKKAKPQPESETEEDPAPLEEDFPLQELHAVVVEQSCCAKTVGIKQPKAIREFTLVFRTDAGEVLKFKVPEEMYEGFEEGQEGVLSYIDDILYAFTPDKEE